VATAIEHGQKVLASIVPNGRDELDLALRYLLPEHFQDPTQRNLFLMLERYADITGAVMTRDAFDDLISKATADAGKAALYLETYDLLVAMPSSPAEFRWSMNELRDLAAQRETGRVITEAMGILQTGLDGEHGKRLKGHEDARTHVLAEFAEIDRSLAMQEAPEGAIRHQQEEILQDYADRKRATSEGRNVGVDFGLRALDYKIGGLQPGDFALIAGYSSDGKTSLVVQLAWAAAVQQGKNVVIATTETTQPQVRRKLVARHSTLEQFGLTDGLNSRALRDGTLDADEERVLPEVVTDLTRNPAYGEVYIKQIPRGQTLAQLESALYRIHRSFPIDVCVMDYLALLKAERRRESIRDELGTLMKESKQIATTFDDGRGLIFVSPWQVNRTAYDNALRLGYYTTLALSETAEATNSPDIIVSVLNQIADSDARFAELKLQLLKNRDGETASSLMMAVDYATCNFSEKVSNTGIEGVLDGTEDQEFGGLLGM